MALVSAHTVPTSPAPWITDLATGYTALLLSWWPDYFCKTCSFATLYSHPQLPTFIFSDNLWTFITIVPNIWHGSWRKYEFLLNQLKWSIELHLPLSLLLLLVPLQGPAQQIICFSLFLVSSNLCQHQPSLCPSPRLLTLFLLMFFSITFSFCPMLRWS